jgi:hypothetical protein
MNKKRRLKKDNAFTKNRKEKFRFGERKKGARKRYHLISRLAETKEVSRYGFAARYPTRRMMVRWFETNSEKAIVFSETQ